MRGGRGEAKEEAQEDTQLLGQPSKPPAATAIAKEATKLKVVEILDTSETYMQHNLNAVCNNLSLLALHTFEFGNRIEEQRQDLVLKEKIARNIEAHASFITGKSEKMARRL